MQRNLTGDKGVAMTNETKIAFLLNILEPLIVNDLNNELAISNDLLEILVLLLKT